MYRSHPNFRFVWYEDMKADLQKVIRETCAFTGYHLTDLKVLQLDDLLYVDNFRKKYIKGAGEDKDDQEK